METVAFGAVKQLGCWAGDTKKKTSKPSNPMVFLKRTFVGNYSGTKSEDTK